MYITYCLSKPSKELAAEMSERMQKNGDEEGAAFFKQHTDPNTIRAYLEYLRNMQKEIFAQNMNNRLGINENALHVWTSRGYIYFDESSGRYCKSPKYLSKHPQRNDTNQ